MGINDKGLVTYDRQTRKDAFYFYQANWSRRPMVYITSRRHTQRTEAKTDIKVYSNCHKVDIVLNGQPLTVESRGMGIFVARDVTLRHGENQIVARALDQRQAAPLTDQCTWTLEN